jgi:hypothetical protein
MPQVMSHHGDQDEVARIGQQTEDFEDPSESNIQ